MTTQLLVFGVLGVLTTAYAVWANRWLFGEQGAGPVGVIEAAFYVSGVVSVCIGWYFNVRYTHHVGSQASYVAYTKALFANFAADSAAQDYIMVNVVLLPLWTVVDGRRRGYPVPVDLLRRQPVHEPRLRHGLLPGGRGASGAGAAEDGAAGRAHGGGTGTRSDDDPDLTTPGAARTGCPGPCPGRAGDRRPPARPRGRTARRHSPGTRPAGGASAPRRPRPGRARSPACPGGRSR